MKYRYVGGGQFLYGLPTRDLDESELSSEALAVLQQGVSLGLYVLDRPEKRIAQLKAEEAVIDEQVQELEQEEKSDEGNSGNTV